MNINDVIIKLIANLSEDQTPCFIFKEMKYLQDNDDMCCNDCAQCLLNHLYQN